jgi:hypothetical protein
MRKFVSRAVATLGVAIVLLAPSLQTPVAQAQVPEPPVQLLIGTASVGNLAAAAVLVNNRTNGLLSEIDLRCAFEDYWTFVDSWAGDRPGFNRGVWTRQSVPRPDGVTGQMQVVSWINLFSPPLRAQGPFIYVFNTGNRAGITYCTVFVIIARDPLGVNPPSARNRNITSDVYVFTPSP